MDPDQQPTHEPSDASKSEEGKTNFLQSMGFGAEELEALETNPEEEGSEKAEDVALSSVPRELSSLASEETPRPSARVVGVQVGSNPERNPRIQAAGTNTHAAAGEPSSSPEEESHPAPAAGTSKDSDVLALHCPRCDGELVLRREHVGVEGACVWCDTRIVAAHSGVAGEVRVLPLADPEKAAQAPEPEARDASGDESSPAEDSVPESSQIPSDFADHSAPAEAVGTVETETDGDDHEITEMPEGNGPPAQPEPAKEPVAVGFDSPAVEEPATDENENSPAGAPSGFEMPEGFGAANDSSREVAGSSVDSAPTKPAAEGEANSFDFSGFGSHEFDARPAEEASAQNDDESSASMDWSSFPETPAPASGDAATAPAGMADDEPSDFAAPTGFSGFGTSSPAAAPTNTPSETETPDSFAALAADFGGPNADPAQTPTAEEEDQKLPTGFGSPGGFSSSENEGLSGEPGPSSAPAPFSQSPAEFSPPDGGAPATDSGFGQNDDESSPPAAENAWSGATGHPNEPSIELGALPAPASAETGPFPDSRQEADPADAMPTVLPEHPQANGEAGGGENTALSGFGQPAPAPAFGQPGSSGPPATATGEVATGEVATGEVATGEVASEEAEASGFGIPAANASFFPAEASTDDNAEKTDPAQGPADSFEAAMSRTPEVAGDPASPISPPEETESPFFTDGSEGASFFDPSPAEESNPANLFAPNTPDEDGGNPAGAHAFTSPGPPPIPEAPSPLPDSSETASEAPESSPAASPFGSAAPAVEESAAKSESKPKSGRRKGPRKGLVVLLVVLVGFVCGAALASFVLPVDQYVLKARNFMEAKFEPAGAMLNQEVLVPEAAGTNAASKADPTPTQPTPASPTQETPPQALSAQPTEASPTEASPTEASPNTPSEPAAPDAPSAPETSATPPASVSERRETGDQPGPAPRENTASPRPAPAAPASPGRSAIPEISELPPQLIR